MDTAETSGEPAFPLPPWPHNAQGDCRRIGIEIEMSGLSLDRLAEVTAQQLGLRSEIKSRYERLLTGDPAGDWLVELDFNLLKEMGRVDRRTDDVFDDVRHTAESLLHWVAETVVPLELVSPPLSMNRLSEVETLISALRNAGATGSSDHVVNAFGMQFNPEVPASDAATLTAYMKAFLCLYEWLLKRADINVTRRITTYIDPFPAEYVSVVLAPDYAPDLPTFIDDYLSANPTRNRALDWLPLFAYVDPDRVKAVTRDPLIKPRPTLHYRLPNCEIHRPDWGLSRDWHDWLEVERLAADPERLKACSEAYGRYLRQSSVHRWLTGWEQVVEEQWLSR